MKLCTDRSNVTVQQPPAESHGDQRKLDTAESREQLPEASWLMHAALAAKFRDGEGTEVLPKSKICRPY